MKSKAISLTIWSFFFILISVTTPLSAGYTVIEDRFQEKIKTPSLKDVQKAKIRLDNGIEAYIVSDPRTPKSGVALAVGVGNAHEPFESVGLAHFVEHMLFMGNEKYPIEKEYHEFIQENGGVSNAYTSSSKTVYMYEINNDKMSEAFTRFSAFFDKPLFNESGLGRERLAVDNEFTYRANSDGLREYLVFLEMTDKRHHLNCWRCGNKETLASIPRDDLVKWHGQYYGADKMKLVMYTAQPLEQAITEIDQNLSCVKPSEMPSNKITGPLLDTDNLAQMVYIEPIKDLKSLTLIWEVPQEFSHDYDHHTRDLAALALSENYPGSLNSLLKEKGYIQDLSAGAQTIGGEISLFQVSAELTEKGVDHVDEIIGHIYEGLARLKKEGIPRYRYDEMVNIAKTNYHYQSRPKVMNFVSSAADSMTEEGISTYPQKHSWPTKFSPDRNQAFLNTLNAENAVYLVMAPSELINRNLDQTEKLTGAKYCKEKIAPSKIQAWNATGVNRLIGMAPPNPYVPTNLDLVNSVVTKDDSAPELISQSAQTQVYHKTDSTYLVPEVYYSVYVASPKLNSSTSSQILTDFYTLSMADALSGLADQGSLAGLHYAMSCEPNLGLNIVVQGYSEKSQLFLDEIISKVKSHKASRGEFLRYKQKLKSYYENQTYKQQPYAQASEVSRSVLFKDYATFKQKLEMINQMSYGDFQNFQATLFDQVYVRANLYGNLDQNEAQKVSSLIQSSFSESQTYPLNEQKRRAILGLTERATPKFITEQTQMDGNAALLIVSQGDMEPNKVAALKVLTKSISSPFFDTLRTKQQTGYVVQFYSQEIEKQLFSFYVVFSNSHSPRDLLARFELFNEDFIKTFNSNEFSKEKFEKIKAAVLEEYSQPVRNLAQKGSELTSLAFNYDADFELKQKNIEAIKALTFEDFQIFTKTYLGRQNGGRFAALVEGQIDPEKALDYTPVQNVNLYKAQLHYTSKNFIEENHSE